MSEFLHYFPQALSFINLLTLVLGVIGGLIQVTVTDAKGINVGMLVSGPGFQAGTLVTGVDPVTNTVTLSKRSVEAAAGRPVYFYLTAGEYLSTVESSKAPKGEAVLPARATCPSKKSNMPAISTAMPPHRR